MKARERYVIRRQLYEASRRRGDDSEKFVVGLLEEYNSKNKLPAWILGWNHHEKWSYQDINGVDVTIYTDSGEIHVNVKSSDLFLKNFNKHHGEKGIMVFILDKNESRGEAFGRLYGMLKKKYRQISGSC